MCEVQSGDVCQIRHPILEADATLTPEMVFRCLPALCPQRFRLMTSRVDESHTDKQRSNRHTTADVAFE
jgi:hypothetical protein